MDYLYLNLNSGSEVGSRRPRLSVFRYFGSSNCCCDSGAAGHLRVLYSSICGS